MTRPLTRVVNLHNTYTDASQPSQNLLLGSLQLLGWLIFRPSAWRSHLERIDKDLAANFALADLTPEQWRNPALRRLLSQVYLVYPLLTAAVMWNVPLPHLVFGAIFSLAFGIMLGTLVSVRVAAFMIPLYGLMLGLNGWLYGTPTELLVHGFTLGVAAAILGRAESEAHTTSVAKQVRGILVGALISVIPGVALGQAGGLTSTVAGSVPEGEVIRVGRIGLLAVLLVWVLVWLGAWWRTRRRNALLFGARYGLAMGIVTAVVFYIAGPTRDYLSHGSAAVSAGSGIILGSGFGAWFVISYILGDYLAGPQARGVAGALGTMFGWLSYLLITRPSAAEVLPAPMIPLLLLSILLGLTLFWWLPVLLWPFEALWAMFLYRADQQRAVEQRSLLGWHPAFWDEEQYLRLSGLDEHLVLVAEHDTGEARLAMDFLVTSRQRWAVQRAQVELDARILERCRDFEAIAGVEHRLSSGELVGPASSLLRSISRLSHDADAILHQTSTYHQRLRLRDLEDRTDQLIRELSRSNDPYALRFYPTMTGWREIIAGRMHKMDTAAEARQEIENPYIIGNPLTAEEQVFVGRTDVAARIEQLLLDRQRMPLLLYGQRQMGKTSLLNNLQRLLPSNMVPLFVDLQGLTTAETHAGFLERLAASMIRSAHEQRGFDLPPLSLESLVADPFARFSRWLDDVEDALGSRMALLELDEFETLDQALSAGRFDARAVLGVMRNLIQHRRHFKVLVAGSHTLDELDHWAGYLINVQIVEVSYLKEEEARRLIETPVPDFPLRYEPEAMHRVLELTHRHPSLIQLLCREIVDIKNKQAPEHRRVACLGDVEAAVEPALRTGSAFFADLERHQIDAVERMLLRLMAAQGAGTISQSVKLEGITPDEIEQALALLLRRSIIEPVAGGYCFQVELIQRWFALPHKLGSF